jgi:hypothetical protein
MKSGLFQNVSSPNKFGLTAALTIGKYHCILASR